MSVVEDLYNSTLPSHLSPKCSVFKFFYYYNIYIFYKDPKLKFGIAFEKESHTFDIVIKGKKILSV